MLTYVRQYVDLAMIFTKSLEFLVSALLHKKSMLSVLLHCWLGTRKSIRPEKNE